MSVSVLMPTYNRPALLDRAVRSWIAAGADQIIVIDDASTVPVVNVWGDPVEVHRRAENGGVAAAVNDALGHVRCEWVCRSADDDVQHPDKLTVLNQWADKSSWRALFHDVQTADGAPYLTGMPPATDYPANRYAWRKRVKSANRFYGGATMIDAALVRSYRHEPSLRYCQDWVWNAWVEARVGWNYVPRTMTTIGREPDGLEARFHTSAIGRENSKRASALVREILS